MKSVLSVFFGVSVVFGSSVAFADSDVSRNYEMTGFDAIDVEGVFELDVEVGPEFSIEVFGPKKELDRVQISVENNVLRLDQEKRRGMNWGNREGVRVRINMPTLVGLNISGVVDGDVSGIDAGRFGLDLSGVGEMELSGSCGELDADVSGVGDLDARKLECGIVDIDVSGVGDATVFASEEVDAQVSGMGDINVYGSPEVVRKDGTMFSDITIH